MKRPRSVEARRSYGSPDTGMQVRVGCYDTLPVPMTKEQAKRWGDRNMPADLKRVGFETVIFTADPEINGWSGYRVNYGMRVAS